MKVGVIEIGSPKRGNVGWAIASGHECCDAGTNLDRCIERLAEVLRKEPLALGFEAPLLVPMRCKAMALTEALDGDGGRPFSAGAVPRLCSLRQSLFRTYCAGCPKLCRRLRLPWIGANGNGRKGKAGNCSCSRRL